MPVVPPNPVIKNEKGRIEIVYEDKLQTLSWTTLKFRWMPGFDVEPGGGMEIILLTRFPTNRWSLPQTNDPTAPGYVTALAEGNTIVVLDILRWPLLQKPHLLLPPRYYRKDGFHMDKSNLGAYLRCARISLEKEDEM